MRQALLRATEEKMVSTAKAQDDAAAAEARAIDAEEVADKLRDAIRRANIVFVLHLKSLCV